MSCGAGLTRRSDGQLAAASWLGMLPLTDVYNAAGDLEPRSRWVGSVGGCIERYDLFSMRQWFRHSQPAETGAEPGTGEQAGSLATSPRAAGSAEVAREHR